MKLPALEEMEAAAGIVYRTMPPTPQYRWPLLCEDLGAQVWLKHENHTPVGAFKLRGGLAWFSDLEGGRGVIAATRGNHGQSVAFCARSRGLRATIVVPHGNSVEKNAAMRALAAERDLHFVPSFHPRLVAGVASASLELLRAVPDLQVLYVPIGLGSGICGAAAARNALGSKCEIVGVVSAHARAYAESFAARRPVEAEVGTVLGDGMACRTPVPEALEIIWRQVERIVEVSDEELSRAIGIVFQGTHNCAKGAGAAAYAAMRQERARLAGRKVAGMLSGGNIDRDAFAAALRSS